VYAGRCGCLLGFELGFCWCKLQLLVEPVGAGLAAVAVNAVVLIWKLARMDFLTTRQKFEDTLGVENI